MSFSERAEAPEQRQASNEYTIRDFIIAQRVVEITQATAKSIMELSEIKLNEQTVEELANEIQAEIARLARSRLEINPNAWSKALKQSLEE
jgi:hypothetical protein